MTELELRNSYVSVLKSWVGAKQGSNIHREIIDTYNTISPLPRGYKVSYNDAWCAATASAAAKKAGLTSIIPAECSCSQLIKKYQALGRWVEDDAYVPSVGDSIFYDWQDSGVGDNRGDPDHVGVVESVTGNTIIVIEGNMNNAVGRRTITVNGKFIRGYGCPNFASLATKSEGYQLMDLISSDGVITNKDYWAAVVDGTKVASAANVKALIKKYHEVLSGTKSCCCK